jgi:preprotein translocase subunit SecA
MREFERRVVLSVLDRKWREHLYEMDYLREGIGLRGWAQRDPLVEYQREGYDMFNTMMDGIKEESVGSLFNLQVEVQENPIVEEAATEMPDLGHLAPPAPAAGDPAAGTGSRARQPAGGQNRGRHAADSGNGRHAAGDDAGAGESAASVVAPGLSRPQRPGRLSYSAPSADGGGQVEHRTEASGNGKYAKVGRNAPCPCGSGRKYKMCHGAPGNRTND